MSSNERPQRFFAGTKKFNNKSTQKIYEFFFKGYEKTTNKITVDNASDNNVGINLNFDEVFKSLSNTIN